MGQMSARDVELTLAAIDLRNKVVHEGHAPGQEVYDPVIALLRVAGSFLPGPKLRFPPVVD